MAKGSFKLFVEQELGKFPHFVIYAVLEWVLILVLFIDGFLAFFANEFARFFELKIPCLFCTRIDHVLVRRAADFYYNDSICESHRKDISCLAYCHNHKKLSDIQKLCESCLLSFATEKSSDCHRHRSLVGISHKDFELLANNDQDHHVAFSAGRKDEPVNAEKSRLNRCSCCGEPLKEKSQLKGKGASFVSQAPTPSPRAPFANLRHEEHRSMDLPHVRYTELKFSGSESDLHRLEDGPIASPLGRQSKEDVKAASVPLLTDAEDMHEDRTPNFGRANKFFGIPLTDSANNSPMWATRINRKSPFERTEFASDSTGGNAPNESDGDLILHHLKGQVKLDPKSLMALYMELDEERSASAIAANNAMAMITRLQAEKAAVQMEAWQYQRMMEEQAEYDQEALQAANDLLANREEQIMALEAENEEYRIKFGTIRPEGVEGSGEKSDEDCHEYNSPTNSSADGRINRQFRYNFNQPSLLSDENGEGTSPVKFRNRARAGFLFRYKNLNRKSPFFLDDRLSSPRASLDNAAHMDEGTVQGKLMKELLHLHERVRALEAEDEFSKYASPRFQNDGNGEKLLTEITDNLQKLRQFMSSPFGDDHEA